MPAAQMVQLAAPWPEWYPAAQSLQLVVGPRTAYVPGAHGTLARSGLGQ